MEGEERVEPVERVPRTAQERERLLAGRQAGWEHLLLAARVLARHDELRLRRRDHELGLSSGPFRRLEDEELPAFAERFAHLRWIIREAGRLLESREAALGARGAPGDVELIEHLADKLIRVSARLLEWADGVRAVGVPERFGRTTELLTRAADECLAGIDRFVADLVADLDSLPGRLAAREEGDPPLTMEIALTLDADRALLDEVVAELRRSASADDAG